MIVLSIPKPIDRHADLIKAEATMRSAVTHDALDRAIANIDLACASILSSTLPVTAADFRLHQRAQDWVSGRTGNVARAHDAISSMAMYRQRRVAPGRPYMNKEAAK